MDEVAPVTVRTVAILKESAACFCLVLGVCLLVFLQLMQSMSKFALFLIGTVPVLHKLFAQLRFLFICRTLRGLLPG